MKIFTLFFLSMGCIIFLGCAASKKSSYKPSKAIEKKQLKNKIKDVSHVVHVSHHKHAQGLKV